MTRARSWFSRSWSRCGKEDSGLTAERLMWDYYLGERACGACRGNTKLDRTVGTNKYGRLILRKWRAEQTRGLVTLDAPR